MSTAGVLSGNAVARGARVWLVNECGTGAADAAGVAEAVELWGLRGRPRVMFSVGGCGNRRRIE